MMDYEYYTKSEKTPTDEGLTFSGNENFHEFKRKFQQYCTKRGFADIIDPIFISTAPPCPEELFNKRIQKIPTTSDEDAKMKDWRDFHIAAVAAVVVLNNFKDSVKLSTDGV